MSYLYLLDIAIILITTKIFGLITKRFHMPQVVGALIAGLVFGPAMLNVLHKTEFLSQLAELGVIVLMFGAGLETNLKDLKRNGKSGFLIALLGVIVPIIGGTALGFYFNRGELAQPGNQLLQNIFIGVIFTATSVSISVETLKEMGKLNTNVGNTILAAALIDDILGLICLTIVSSLSGSDTVSIFTVLIKILLFFVLAAVIGYLLWWAVCHYSYKNINLRRYPILSFAFCLIMSFVSEYFFGVADIIGAFAAGVVIGGTPVAPYVKSRFEPLSYLLLTPVFFASIGIGLTFPPLSRTVLLLAAAVIIVAVLSKLVGCGIGALMCGMSRRQAVQVGLGMVCRGEVALIVANKGVVLNMLSPAFFSSIVIMVIFTSIVTPIFLKLSFSSDSSTADSEATPLTQRYKINEEIAEIEIKQVKEKAEEYKNNRQKKNR